MKMCKEGREYYLCFTTSITLPGNEPCEYLDAGISRILLFVILLYYINP